MNQRNQKRMPPERWITCPKFGDPVTPTKFIPLKAPWETQNLWEKHSFTFSMFCQAQRAQGRQVVAVISLRRVLDLYIDSDEIIVKHVPCEGHNGAPTTQNYNDFLSAVDEIYSKCQITPQDNKYIAVHCTHGYNRTGYIIARYLHEKCGYTVQDAINRFAQCRPPGIYKQNYVDTLYGIYGIQGSTIVHEPDWYHPDPSTLAHFTVRSPIENETAALETLGDSVDKITEYMIQANIVKHCNDDIYDPYNTRFPGSNPISITKENISTLEGKRYTATYKSDGVRYFLYAYNGHSYLINRSFVISRVNVNLVNRDGTPMQDTIIDGELVEDKHKDPQAKEHGKFNIHFLIFDVLYIEGTNLCKDKWDIRMDYSKKGIVQYRELFFQKHPEKRMEEDFDIEEKKQWKMEDIMDLKEYMNDPELNHNTDGVILTPLDLHFVKGRCDQILKMKPIELNSVDFRASWGNGVCYLSVANDVKDGKTFHEDIPIAIFDFEDEEVKASVKDGTIIECVMDLLQEEIDADPTKQCFFTKGWRPLRIRVDKDSANAYGTFVGVFKSIQDDITYKTLHNMFPK